MSFVTTEDVRKRLGFASLTRQQDEQIGVLIGLVDSLIIDAVGKDAGWAAELDPVPPMLPVVAMTVVCRSLANPTGAAGLSETLGQFSHSERFNDASEAGLSLTEREERLVRRAVFGTDADSAQAEHFGTETVDEWGGIGLDLSFYPLTEGE